VLGGRGQQQDAVALRAGDEADGEDGVRAGFAESVKPGAFEVGAGGEAALPSFTAPKALAGGGRPVGESAA
jgi:hypothetical protein